MFKNYKLHHIGVVHPSLEAAETFIASFSMVEDYRGYVDRWQCWCIFTVPGDGGTAIELVVATGGPLLRFNKGAGGVHHMAFEVPDIEAETAWIVSQGMSMIEPHAIKGAGNFLCNFLSPASTRGIQVELVQPL